MEPARLLTGRAEQEPQAGCCRKSICRLGHRGRRYQYRPEQSPVPREISRLVKSLSLPRLTSRQANKAETKSRYMTAVRTKDVADLRECGRTARMAGLWSSIWRPYIPLQIPHPTRMRTPLRQRIAAMAQAVAPMDKKPFQRRYLSIGREASRALHLPRLCHPFTPSDSRF